MHKELIAKAFERIKEIERQRTGILVSNSASAKLLSDFIFERKKIQFWEKSLSDYYRCTVNNDGGEVIIKQPKVIEALCELLDFENFIEFKKVHGLNQVELSPKRNVVSLFADFLNRHKIPFVVSSITIIIMLVIFYINRQRWMIWESNQYIEVRFDQEKYSIGQLKLYNKETINHFKKVEVNCETEFFDSNGGVKIWYGKNNKKELEYFNAIGFHPETGKSLDPITEYMIRKYICKE